MNSKTWSLGRRWHSLSLTRPNGKVHQHATLVCGLHRGSEDRAERFGAISVLGPVSRLVAELIVWEKLEAAGTDVGRRIDVLTHSRSICACIWHPKQVNISQ